MRNLRCPVPTNQWLATAERQFWQLWDTYPQIRVDELDLNGSMGPFSSRRAKTKLQERFETSNVRV